MLRNGFPFPDQVEDRLYDFSMRAAWTYES